GTLGRRFKEDRVDRELLPLLPLRVVPAVDIEAFSIGGAHTRVAALMQRPKHLRDWPIDRGQVGDEVANDPRALWHGPGEFFVVERAAQHGEPQSVTIELIEDRFYIRRHHSLLYRPLGCQQWRRLPGRSAPGGLP